MVVSAGGHQVDQIVDTVNINQLPSPVHHRNTGDTTRLKLVHRLRQLGSLGGHLREVDDKKYDPKIIIPTWRFWKVPTTA